MIPTKESDLIRVPRSYEVLIEEARKKTRRRRLVVLVASLMTVSAIVGISLAISHGRVPGTGGEQTTTPAAASVLARSLCRTSLGAQALSSAPGTVNDVRTTFVGAPSASGKLEFANAFPGARGNQIIGWCWTSEPRLYELYAVASRFKSVRIEGLGGATFLRTPYPGPADIP